jgi:hypothetical protein
MAGDAIDAVLEKKPSPHFCSIFPEGQGGNVKNRIWGKSCGKWGKGAAPYDKRGKNGRDTLNKFPKKSWENLTQAAKNSHKL